METKRFPLRVLLTSTTGRLLTKSQGDHDNGISDLYDLLGWMTNDSPFTHQLPRFNDECKPWLLRWFPKLADADSLLPLLDEAIEKIGPERGCEFWLDGLTLDREYDVPRIPRDDHQAKNPYDELVEMRGTDEGVVILQPSPRAHG
jgi:hypothetical protein